MKFLRSAASPRNKKARKGHALNVGVTQKSRVRRENSPRTLTRLMVIGVFFAIVAGLVLATIRQSLAFLTDNPLYAIQSVSVQEPSFLTADEVISLSGVQNGDNLLRLSLVDVRKKILEHPNIREAAVMRRLPNVLRIEIKEREPLAQISIGKNYLVDGEGALLTWNDKFALREWPLIEGLDLKSSVVDNKIQSDPLTEVLQILKLFRGSVAATRMDIQIVRMDEPGGYLLETSKGFALRLRVGLKPEEVQVKFTQVVAVLEDLQKKGIAPAVLDLRFEDIVVTPIQAKAAAPAAGAGERPSKKTAR